MHPEIRQEGPGNCPLCGMHLVPETAGGSQHHPHASHTPEHSYRPLVIIVGLILLVTLAISVADFQRGSFAITQTISYFMTGFFLVFAGFKLIDLRGFAEGYATYDILAKRWFGYGYIYPFIELFFGLAMILGILPVPILIAEVIVMTFSGLGVLQKLWRREQFQCACLGTFLKVPLTKVTLIEDFGMAALAIIMLFLGA